VRSSSRRRSDAGRGCGWGDLPILFVGRSIPAIDRPSPIWFAGSISLNPLVHLICLSAWHSTRTYEITALIGVGGMGEVYRAIDTNLKRAVALKVLPQSVADDADRITRFQREAEVLAALKQSSHCRDLRSGECRRHDRARHGTGRGPDARRSPRQDWRAAHRRGSGYRYADRGRT
jgi:serine/threonine protein kinase